MIKRFLDHTANERTYLSWITTSVAIMAFGFVIERFDIFISYVGRVFGKNVPTTSYLSANIAGAGLLVLAVVIILIATFRFFMFKRAIDAEESLPFGAALVVVMLGLLMVLLGGFLAFYMATNFSGMR